jgi:hypothetical protein
MTRLLATAGLLVALASPVHAIDFQASESGTIEFDMPSGNICCSYIADAEGGPLLACTRVKPRYWIVHLRSDGELTVFKNPGEVPGCGYGEPLGNVFNYGSTWKKSGFKCTSSASGLKCQANGAGFKLSRSGIVEY